MKEFSKFILYYKITKKLDKCYLIKNQSVFSHHTGRLKSIVSQDYHFPIYLNNEVIILNKKSLGTFNPKFPSIHVDYFDHKGRLDKDKSHEIETTNSFGNILLIKLFKKMKTSMKTPIEVQDEQELKKSIEKDLIVINREEKLNELL